MVRNLKIVRGYFGSGRSSTAARLSLQNDATTFSLDTFLDESLRQRTKSSDSLRRDAPDIITSGSLVMANVRLNEAVEKEVQKGERNVVVDTYAAKLWELKKYTLLARQCGYAIEIHSPDSSWARDPAECGNRTKYPINRSSWSSIVQDWEENSGPSYILAARSPTERLEYAKSVLARSDTLDPDARRAQVRYIFDDFPESVTVMAQTGFIGVNGEKQRQMHLQALTMERRMAPIPVEYAFTPQIDLYPEFARMRSKIESLQKHPEPPPKTPDLDGF